MKKIIFNDRGIAAKIVESPDFAALSENGS